MAEEPDDTSSNPHADAHLPVSGEFDANNVPSNASAHTSSSEDEDNPPDRDNDINVISAQNTSQTQTPPNPAGPADPQDIGNPGDEGVASQDQSNSSPLGNA
jgi:hypothetical protein